MRERQQFASNARVATDDDDVPLAPNVSDSRGMGQNGALLQYASRATKKTLDQIMGVHAINCRHAIAREDAARSSPRPLPEWTS